MLKVWGNGDPGSADRLIPAVYHELRRMALGYLHRERRNHTLQPTALVNEAYLRLARQQGIPWKNRAHFFAIAAKMMRRVLLDHARRHGAEKRGGEFCLVPLDEALDQPMGQGVEMQALDSALDALAVIDEFKARLVELRYFVGLSVAETAEVLECSNDTVTRHWRRARAWLCRELQAQS
jgi:RNA polymerase sigma factor (TIGR02999 family)